MNIGFDLDKVFINYPPLVPANIIDKLYKKKSNGILIYRIPKKPEQIFRRLTHHPFLRPPITENLSFLEKIPKSKYKLYLISSRFSFLQKRTENIIKKYNFDSIFKGMYFNYMNIQPHEFKDIIIKQLKIEKYVDDDFSLIEYLAKHNPSVTFYWLNPLKTKKIKKNIYAIQHLSEMSL